MDQQRHRIDKFLWYVRLFKHRNQASKACELGQVLINGHTVKSSTNVRIGDIIAVKYFFIYKQYRVIAFPENRLPAKLVSNFIEDITPLSDIEKLKKIQELNRFNPKYEKGGRPTKKDRRLWDDFFDNLSE